MERNAMPARRRLALAALIVAAAAATPAALYAQTGQWPTRPVKLVVPFPPGGSTDAIGRLLAVELARIWARPSSSRTRAAPTAISARTRWPRPSRTATRCCCRAWARTPSTTRFTPACLTATATSRMSRCWPPAPTCWWRRRISRARPSRTSSGWRARADKYTHASSGSGSSGHLAMEMLKQQARIDLVHVPYKGGAAAITDLLGGRVTVLFLTRTPCCRRCRPASCGRWRWPASSAIRRIPTRRRWRSPAIRASRPNPGSACRRRRTPPAVIQRLSRRRPRPWPRPRCGRSWRRGLRGGGQRPASLLRLRHQ